MDKGHPDVARTYFRAVVSVDPLSPEAGQAATLLQQMGQ
jgi:hypothetical protein